MKTDELAAVANQTARPSLFTVAEGFKNQGTIELTGDGGFGTQVTVSGGKYVRR